MDQGTGRSAEAAGAEGRAHAVAEGPAVERPRGAPEDRFRLLAERQRAILDAERDPQSLLVPVRQHNAADGTGAEGDTVVDFEFVDTNAAFATLAGRPREELVGARLRDIFPAELAERGIAIYARALHSPEPVESHAYGLSLSLDRAAATRLYDVRAVRVGDGVLVSARDVTEQEETLTSISDSRERYRLLAEHASDLVVRTGPDRRFTWVSESVSAVLGWAAEEVIGRRLEDFAGPGEDGYGYPEREDLYAGQRAIQESGRMYRMRTKDGGFRLLAGRPVPVFDAQGRPDGVVAGFKDVTELVAARDEAAAQGARLRAAVNSLLDPYALVAAVRDGAEGDVIDFTVLDANPAACAYLGLDPAHAVGASLEQVLPASARELFHVCVRALSSRSPVVLDDYTYETVPDAPGGPRRRLDIRGVPVGDAMSLTWRDVTDRYEQTQAVIRSEAFLRTIMAAAPIGMSVHDLAGTCLSINDAMCRIIGRDRQWAVGRAFADILPADVLAAAQADVDRLLRGEVAAAGGEAPIRRPDGTVAWVKTGAAVIPDDAGAPAALLALAEDITADREAAQVLAYQAFHDPLTGLRNRAWLLDMLEVELRTADRNQSHVGVLFIDLDNFKLVNDTLGHAAGDEVLTSVAARIGAVLRPRDHGGRFGGDEFVVIVADASGPGEVERVAVRVSQAIGSELLIQGHRMIPTASIGIAVSEPDATAAALLRQADAALFLAKSSGRHRWQFFDAAMHAAAQAREQLEGQIREGLDAGQFTVHYQPIVDLANGRLAGREALLRWQHPVRGLLAAADFLAVAEETGLLVPLGQLVQAQVCRQLTSPGTPGPISMNVSAVELAAPDWLGRLLDRLAAEHVDPRNLVLEVTESAVLNLLDSARTDLQRLRSAGIGVHVDDFGTGFSPIALLREFPVTGVKLDRSLVAGVTATDSPATVLAAGLAGLARGLRLTAVAEGIETVEQSLILARQGWTHGQGFFFGRPMALDTT